MKLCIIPDIHGKPIWKKIIKNVAADRYIFLGDYYDSFNESERQYQIANFYEIVDWSKNNDADLLIGNHEYHYLKGVSDRYSGYNHFMAIDIRDALEDVINQNLIKLCVQYNNFVFVHAGITKTWCKNNQIDMSDMVNDLNRRFQEERHIFRFSPGEEQDASGDEICQSPIWVRPNSLEQDMVEGFTFVVGHTHFMGINIKSNVIYTDVLDNANQVLIIDTETNETSVVSWT